MGRTPAEQLAPGVWRIPTAQGPVLGEVDYDVVAFTHGPEIRDNARRTVQGFLRDKAVAQ
jgi:hypothetical protein